MPELVYISPNNTSISLTNNRGFLLTDAEGLTQSDVAISATEFGSDDGSIVNSLRAQPRGIVLYLTVKSGQDVETVKRDILSIIKPKQTGRLLWTQNGRTIEIDGVVNAVSMPRFTNNAVMQITLYCPQAFWQDAEYNIRYIELVDALHHFVVTFPQGKGIPMGVYNLNLTKTFDNFGDAATGVIITIIATGEIKNPLLERSDGLFFGVNETMQAGDSIVINTTKGHKSVEKNGVNIMNSVKEGSTWLQLETGSNTFTISDEERTGAMYFTFEYKQKYV